MSVTYKKATTKEQIIKYLRDLDIEYIKQHGTTIVLPIIDNQTKKIIIRELKRLKIFNKVNLVMTNDVKSMYQKTLETAKKKIS